MTEPCETKAADEASAQRGAMAWLGRHELGTLVGMLMLMATVWCFVVIADEVQEGDTRRFDRAVLMAMRSPENPAEPYGPPWLQEMGRDLTALGGAAVLVLLTLAVCGYLLLHRKRHATLLVLLAVGGGQLLSLAMKWSFSRPRPDLVPYGSLVYTTSFPSGHSMMAAVTYLTLGALLARVQPRASMKAYLLLLAAGLTILVGVSRVYLGVHWPTDVLAGWTAGAAWALLCWLLARYLQRRGTVEPS